MGGRLRAPGAVCTKVRAHTQMHTHTRVHKKGPSVKSATASPDHTHASPALWLVCAKATHAQRHEPTANNCPDLANRCSPCACSSSRPQRMH